MDITKQSIHFLLPRLLNALAECHFIALDLELSGIALRQTPGRTSKSSAGKQTLQQRYEEVKEAAERYQILQIGLTLATEDVEAGAYTLKPYNLYLNPVPDQRLGIERRWSYQSGAVDFLMANGFRMEAPYTDGLPYLSREEEALIKADLIERQNFGAIISDIDVKDTDEESLGFLKAAREDIDEWIARCDAGEDYLNIPQPTVADAVETNKNRPTTINNFQKRLVHQLVRAEYPLLVSIGRSTFIQIVHYNKEREDGVQVQKSKRMLDRVAKQIGFRWVVEGMVGGDLSNLDPACFLSVMSSSTAIEAEFPLLEYSQVLQRRLKENRPVLVGHNLFTDLVNFYKCFFGELPDRVEDFQAAIHELFPIVIDTKYMATHNCGSINPKSSLEEIDESMRKKEKPVIDIDAQHGKYELSKPLHEAGYDSLLTAQVLIRLSAQLQSEGASFKKPVKIVEKGNDGYSTIYKERPSANGIGRNGQVKANMERKGSDESLLGCILTGPSTVSSQKYPSQQPIDWTEPTEFDRIRSAFAHRTRFDLLTDQTEDIVTLPLNGHGSGDSTPPAVGEPLLSFPEDVNIEEMVAAGDLMPRFDSAFWEVYGNKLRVFGTEEGVCFLNGESELESSVAGAAIDLEEVLRAPGVGRF